MDLITHLPTSERLNLVFTIVDRFSKYLTFVPYKATCTAFDLARMFYEHIVCKFGMPQKIVTGIVDFYPSSGQTLMCLLQSILAMSSGYHPQTDGQSEHFHHSVEQILHCYVTASQSNWVVSLAFNTFALNSTVSVAHGKSPLFCLAEYLFCLWTQL